jgi:hypothetical protein
LHFHKVSFTDKYQFMCSACLFLPNYRKIDRTNQSMESSVFCKNRLQAGYFGKISNGSLWEPNTKEW